LLPLLKDQSSSAQFLVPMAISLGFGILFATAFTLVLVPANIMIADDVAKYFKARMSEMRGSVVTEWSRSPIRQNRPATSSGR
jgi:uncharacterized membrane protein YagU involved in acid resistance